MNFGILLLSLIITVAFYCVIPLLIAYLKKTPVTTKSYRRTCFFANIAIIFLFVVINGSASGASGGYLLWTWVFSNVGSNILRKRELLIEDAKKLVVTADMYKFVCTKCNSFHTGWYSECPNCKAKGSMKKGSDEEIRKWNNLPEEAPAAETANTPTNPSTALGMYKFICTKCNSLHTGWYNSCPKCQAIGAIKKGSEEEIRKWNRVPEPSPVDPSFIAVTPVATTTPAPVATAPINSSFGFCRHCGARLLEDSAFCSQCGTKVL